MSKRNNFEDYLRSRTREDIEREILKFREEIVGGNDNNKLLEKIGIVCKWIPFITADTPPGMKIYRAKKNCRDNNGTSELFNKVEEVWYPPKNRTKLGRCNHKNKPVLYVAGKWEGAILEIRPQKGDWITVGEYRLKKKARVLPIRIFANRIESWEELRRARKKTFQKMARSSVAKTRMVEKFLSELFVQIQKRNDIRQKTATATISEFYLRAEFVDGILYPSISRSLTDWNIAFKTQFADQNVLANRFVVFEVVEFIEKEGKVDDMLTKVKAFGEIIEQNINWNWVDATQGKEERKSML